MRAAIRHSPHPGRCPKIPDALYTAHITGLSNTNSTNRRRREAPAEGCGPAGWWPAAWRRIHHRAAGMISDLIAASDLRGTRGWQAPPPRRRWAERSAARRAFGRALALAPRPAARGDAGSSLSPAGRQRSRATVGGHRIPDRATRRWQTSAAEDQPTHYRKFYATRHTFITLALSEGADAYGVARYAGTSLVMIEKHYGKYLRRDGGVAAFVPASGGAKTQRSRPPLRFAPKKVAK